MPNMIKVWPPEAVTECMREALAIVEDIEPPHDLRSPVFTAAASMLANCIIQQDAVPVPLPPFLNGKLTGH